MKTLQLKNKIKELLAKYDTLYKQSLKLCAESSDTFEEMKKDIASLDEICKERNRY